MTPEIEMLLKQRLGLDAESIGSSSISRAVQNRMSVRGLNESTAYLDYLIASDSEMQQLIELVVVPETWFFRDVEAFATLAQFAVKEWFPAHPHGMLRLLSLPCSTGEEAYSMTMALFDAGIPANRFCVDAVDISAQALARAREAVYGKNSFRSRDLSFRDRYFEPGKENHRLAEAVCRQVHFQSGNMIDADLLPGSEIYDVIFCRNLLIYFDRPTQDRAVGVLARLLKPEGILFVGPSETTLTSSHSFVSMKVPLAFAFRKTASPLVKAKVPVAPAPAIKYTPVIPPPADVPALTAPSPPPPPIKIDIDEAQQFADQGRLVEAVKRCEEFMRAHGPSAKAFYLLGLVRDASGEPLEAMRFYRKALYLNPQHHGSLLHLALILDKQGDKEGAKVLNDRAARVQQKGPA